MLDVLDLRSLTKIKLRAGFDVISNPGDDICSDSGFCRCIALALRLQEGGLAFAGVPCCSFVFVSRSRHRRSATDPMGAQNTEWVRKQNIVASRTTLILLLVLVRRGYYFVENPGGSLLHLFPPMKLLIELCTDFFKTYHIKWWLESINVSVLGNLFVVAYPSGCFP